jgi:ribonuclease P protein component
MLPAANRMRRSREFATVIHHGARARCGSLVLYHQPTLTARDAAPVIGLVVGSAVGGSVVRNVVRRRLRAQLRSRLALLPAGSGTVVRALPASASDDYRALGDDLDRALARVMRPPRTGGAI